MSLASCHLRIEFSRLVTHLRSIGYKLPKDYEYPSFGLHEQFPTSGDTHYQKADTTTVLLKNGLDPKNFGGRPGLLVAKILNSPGCSWEVSPETLGSLFGIQIHDDENEFFNTLRSAVDSARTKLKGGSKLKISQQKLTDTLYRVFLSKSNAG